MLKTEPTIHKVTKKWRKQSGFSRSVAISIAFSYIITCTNNILSLCCIPLYCSCILPVASWQTHTHTRLTALFPGLLRWAGTKKVKQILILVKQKTVSGSGISSSAGQYASLHLAPDWQPHRHPTTLFSRAVCLSCRPTHSVKALKA